MANTPRSRPTNDKKCADRPLWLEIVGTIGQALLAPILGGAIAYYGYTTSKATSRDDVTEKYVSIAVDVLKGKRDTSNNEIFAWAANTLNMYAAVPFTPKAIEQLEGGSLSGNPVSFDVSLHDVINSQLGNAYLTIKNTTSDPLTIKSIKVIGPNDLAKPCELEVPINPMDSIAFSFQARSIKLASIEMIANCLSQGAPTGNHYRLVDVSVSPTFDAFEKAQGHSYSLRNTGFGIYVEYESKSQIEKTLFGAYLHYLVDNGPVSITRGP